MAAAAEGYKTILAPEDEFTHNPGTAENYNESMYFNVFDAGKRAGAWFRLGNRPNQRYAEMSMCVYFPDGRVGFMFARPEISDNSQMNAGGLRIDVVEPFKTLKVTYAGELLVLKEPGQMADPKVAFRNNPRLPCKMEMTYTGLSPMYGGETVKADGSPIEIDPEKSFAKAHYEQHCAAKGFIDCGGERLEIDGHGLRDKSWGPRHWQAIEWYRWCPMNFGPDFGMMFNVMGDGKGGVHQSGMVFRDGIYDQIVAAELSSNWDDSEYQTDLEAKIRTKSGKEYTVTGKVLSLIPLRNRRTAPDGTELTTRITEAMTEYRCDGKLGYGMSEYLDQIVDGRPLGRLAGY
ncbi:MAG: hypothetical protein C0456_05525 [Hyphomonas sp.]|uniref:DUF7064 domain-containing protein n=1 Tax=Hyphomonas sp. TaxID=87 RepID=UPI001DB159B9|nr:hypothetical protein [Hyphomonas sp.]MBA4226076.1 hypothetical protein [Hyphomonas sp.]